MPFQIVQTAARPRAAIAIAQAQIDRSPSPSADFALAMQIANLLDKHYPGHPWATWADHDQGIAVIKNCALDRKLGMIMHIANLSSPNEVESQVIERGGQFLERFNIPRGAMRPQDYEAAKRQF